MTYMGSLDKVIVFVCGNSSLSSLLVHLFQFCGCVLLGLFLNDLDDILVVIEVWALALQSNHVQCCSRLQRSMNVEELPRVLSLVQIG